MKKRVKNPLFLQIGTIVLFYELYLLCFFYRIGL